MSGRKPSKGNAPIPHRADARPLQPSIRVLERFTESDLRTWSKRSAQLDALHHEMYHGLEPERIARRAEIVEALLERPAEAFEFDAWVRMVAYRYANQPLSAAGSVRGHGGRFNIGNDCDQAGVARVFPALYLGDSHETAHREYYQASSADAESTGLTGAELALRKSDVSVRLRGRIDRVFDIRRIKNLEPVAKVLAKFKTTPALEKLARELKLGRASEMLIRSPKRLQENLQEVNWRAWPVQFQLPSPSQRFGQFLRMAGYEGVLYQSAKLPGSTCLAVFAGNIDSPRTFIELMDPHPPEMQHVKLDASAAAELCGWDFVRLQDRDI